MPRLYRNRSSRGRFRVWLYVLVRYRREILRGVVNGWRRRKTYYVTCSVNVSYDGGATWQPLSVDYLRSLAHG